MPIERIPQLVQLSSNSPLYTVGCLVKRVIWSRPLSAETDGKLISDSLLKQTVRAFGGKLEHWAITFYCSSDGATWEPWFTLEHLADPSDQAKLSEGDCSFRHGTPIPAGSGKIYCSEYLLDEFQQLCDKVDEVYDLSTNNCQHYAVNIHDAFTQAMQT